VVQILSDILNFFYVIGTLSFLFRPCHVVPLDTTDLNTGPVLFARQFI